MYASLLQWADKDTNPGGSLNAVRSFTRCSRAGAPFMTSQASNLLQLPSLVLCLYLCVYGIRPQHRLYPEDDIAAELLSYLAPFPQVSAVLAAVGSARGWVTAADPYLNGFLSLWSFSSCTATLYYPVYAAGWYCRFSQVALQQV